MVGMAIAVPGLGSTPKNAEGAIKLYDEWADTYDASLASWGYEAPAKVAELLKGRIAVDAKVLDLGCGTGLSGKALVEAGLTGAHAGVDISPKSVELANASGHYTGGVCVGNLEEPIPEEVLNKGPYGAVICVGTLSYVHNFKVFFAEVLKALSPGGCLVFTHRCPFFEEDSDGIQTEAARLIVEGVWKNELVSAPSAYMPKNPDPEESIKRIKYCVYRLCNAKGLGGKKGGEQLSKGNKGGEQQPNAGKSKKGDKGEGAAAAPVDPEKARKDLLKKVIKEGGKRGVEIEGVSDMGGLQFFCTAVDMPDGDVELACESMKAMNAKSDPTEEERKGGSGHIGKMIFSAGAERLAVVAYVPEAKQGDLSCEEWLQKVLSSHGGEMLSTSKDTCSGQVKTDTKKNVFPLKIREPMILEANNFLRKKGLFPEEDGDSDEMVFGDDDFPS